MRILVVEDEVGVRETVCALLKSENYAVDAVGTAEDGIFMLKENEYDGVVLDLMLPDGSGLDVPPRAKSLESTPIWSFSPPLLPSQPPPLQKAAIGRITVPPVMNLSATGDAPA